MIAVRMYLVRRPGRSHEPKRWPMRRAPSPTSSGEGSSSPTAASGASSASSLPTPSPPARCTTSRAHLHRRLLPLIAAAADSGETVDLQDVLRRFAFDNICGVAFGVESSTLLEVEDRRSRHEEFFRAFDDAVEISLARMFHPTTVVWKTMRLVGVGRERRLREAIGIIDDYVLAMIDHSDERRQLRGDDDDVDEHHHLLSRFAAATEEDDGSGELGAMFHTPEAKRGFLRDVVVSFVLAGKDTTSSALTWFFWLLAANPRCERRVYEEASRHGDEHDGGELKGMHMHYLHAAITEAMRLYPPVPIN